MGALPYVDGTFDIVLSLNGFRAFPDKEAAYREVFRVLRSGGTFCGCFYVKGEQKRTELMKEPGLYDLTPALCHLDYTMSEAGGVTDFVRQYTLASGGPYCDCGYKKKR